MKENVIIGKLIPAGTGMKRYRNVHLNTEYMQDEPEEDDDILYDDLMDYDDVEEAAEETAAEEVIEDITEDAAETDVEETTEE